MDTASLTIPRIPELDSMAGPDEIIPLLDHKGVRRSISCNNWAPQYPYHPLCTFAAAHTGTHLYIDFLVRCNYLRAMNSADQSPVSEDSCVEFFIEPVAGGEYWNLEFNCIGAVNASHRKLRPQATRLSSDEIAMIRRYPSCGTRPFCEVEGLFTWNLLVVIPFSLLGIDRVEPGTAMRGNFYKCASASASPHFLSWSPIDTPAPDFHRPEFFGNLIFE
ncbi:MAG: carbohydrate-binding family 9-like protein [Muribaculaceae bacterium]|nr:carbohydrate-binding family 9-like protein [Muribaculaceae bacterium]